MKKLNFQILCLLYLFLISTTIAGSSNEAARIISAGGSITEIMFALGLGDRIVAVDTSSSFPPQTSALPKVGYFRSLGAEGLMSLNPDMLIAARGAGPKAALDQIESLGVELRTYDQSTYTLESWKGLISKIGADFDKIRAANRLHNEVLNGIVDQQAKRSFEQGTVNAIALLSIGQRGPVAAGRNTVPDLLLELAGINNVARSLEGYKPFSSELLAEQKIDLVLVPTHVVDGLGGRDAICQSLLIQLATSGECHLHVMDGLLLMGFGARLHKAVGEIIRVVGEASN